MRYTVVTATVRQALPEFGPTIERIQSSFEEPTEFHILDGSEGKAQALNKAGEEILANCQSEFYVTLDDDIVPSAGWQSKVADAFGALKQFGALGLWMGDGLDRLALVGANHLDGWRAEGNVRYRRVRPPHHLNGGFIAYRTEVARTLGPIPTEGVRYQLWEDAWRGRRVTQLGWEMAFVDAGPVDMVEYMDPKEYVELKARDLQFGKHAADRVLAGSGLGDSVGLRLRKWVARVRGRAK